MAAVHPEPVPTPDEAPAPLNRRERRAAARGAVPAPKVAGPAGGQLTPPPVRKRNYAARKSG